MRRRDCTSQRAGSQTGSGGCSRCGNLAEMRRTLSGALCGAAGGRVRDGDGLLPAAPGADLGADVAADGGLRIALLQRHRNYLPDLMIPHIRCHCNRALTDYSRFTKTGGASSCDVSKTFSEGRWQGGEQGLFSRTTIVNLLPRPLTATGMIAGLADYLFGGCACAPGWPGVLAAREAVPASTATHRHSRPPGK